MATREAVDRPGGDPTSGSASGLIAFLSWAGHAHEMRRSTASALRTGCQKVLAVESDHDAVDLRTADVDGIVSRFRTEEQGDVKDKTLDVYEQRFRQSVDMYRKWLNDEDWRPDQRHRTSRRSSHSGPRREPRPRAARRGPMDGGRDHVPGPGTITYPFPIRAGVQALLTLPDDLTTREAQRICAFVSALAFDEPETAPGAAALTRGHGAVD